jgi:hypothetical protein
MFRKLTLALVAALGVTALSTTSASAMPMVWPHHHHHWHSGFGLGFLAGGYGGCYRNRLVPTPFGYRWRTVNVCVF